MAGNLQPRTVIRLQVDCRVLASRSEKIRIFTFDLANTEKSAK